FCCISYYLGAFGTVWLPYETQSKTGRTRAKFVPRSRVGIFRNERTRSTPLDPKLTFWCVSYHLVAFDAVGPNYCKSSSHEVAWEFFATNTPDTPHWTLKLRFGAFHTIWLHSGPFGCLTKLGAKQAELVQKFVPRSRVGICRNERTRSSPLDAKLTFCCVSYCLGAFLQRTHPIHPVGP